MRSALHEAAHVDGGAEHVSQIDFEPAPLFRQLTETPQFADVRIRPGKRRIHGDPGQLYRILTGLLQYETDYFPGHKLLLGCRRGNDSVRIDIVRRFTGSDATNQVQRQHPLSELRLEITKRLAKLNSIEIQREYAGNLAFWRFSLPLAHAASNEGGHDLGGSSQGKTFCF